MLQSIRDKIQGLIAGIVATIIAITFALWGVQNYLRGGATSAVAKVNGQEITQKKLQMAYEMTKRHEMLRFGLDFSLDQKQQAKLKQDILQGLIKQEILFQAETKMGLKISKQQLMAIIAGMPHFQVNGHFSPERFQQFVQRLYYSEQAFFDEISHSILRLQLERSIVGSSFVLPNEVEGIKKILQQRRDYGYFVISPERFIKTVQITDDAVQKYYNEHQSEFLLPEKVSIQYLELSFADLSTKTHPTDEQLKQFYQSHLDSFSTPKKWQVTKVLLPLTVKADAKTVASTKKKIEDIALQAKTQKELTKINPEAKVITTWAMRSDLSPDFLAQIDKLNIGQVSTPIRTKDGYSIFKVQAIQPGKVTPYMEVSAKVKQLYEHQQSTQAFTEASDKLADLVYTNSDSLEPAARELGLKIKDTELVTNTGSKSGILANPKIIKATFSEQILKQRYNSSLIEISSGKVIVLRVKEHIPEKVQPLNQVNNVILAKLQTQEAKEKASLFANELLQALRGGKTEAELAKQYSLAWHKVAGAKFGEGGKDAKLVDAVFGLAKPQAKEVRALVVDYNADYVVLRLDKVYDATSFQETSMEKSFIHSLPDILGSFDYQFLLASLEQDAKVKIFATDKQDRTHE